MKVLLSGLTPCSEAFEIEGLSASLAIFESCRERMNNNCTSQFIDIHMDK